MLNKKYDFDRIFGSEINYSLYLLYIKAYSFQANWDLKNLTLVLDKIEKLFEGFLNINSWDFFIERHPENTELIRYLGSKQFKKIKYANIYIETLLQHTAVLS